eukprot:SAG11_NODE_21497_length_424_cov_0.741538_1_plen_132_part_10
MQNTAQMLAPPPLQRMAQAPPRREATALLERARSCMDARAQVDTNSQPQAQKEAVVGQTLVDNRASAAEIDVTDDHTPEQQVSSSAERSMSVMPPLLFEATSAPSFRSSGARTPPRRRLESRHDAPNRSKLD